MKRLLVTGGAGFIGTNFCYYWRSSHPDDRLVILDALTYAGNKENLAPLLSHPQVLFIHGSILDRNLVEHLLVTHRIDTLVHFAAETHVDRSITGPDAFIHTNITGTHTLLSAAANIWLAKDGIPHRFHHISTDEVYGSLGPSDPPFKEISPYAPNSPYAASKAASDHLVRAWHKTFGLQTTISNCSNNYGPCQNKEKLIPLMITRILSGQSIPIYGDGCQIRDWLYVDDHNRGIDLILEKGTPGDTYNIGGDNEWTNLDLTHQVCDQVHQRFLDEPALARAFPHCPSSSHTHPSALITHVTDRPGHDRRYAINAGKIRKLGYAPEKSFDRGIGKTIDWFIQQTDRTNG